LPKSNGTSIPVVRADRHSGLVEPVRDLCIGRSFLETGKPLGEYGLSRRVLAHVGIAHGNIRLDLLWFDVTENWHLKDVALREAVAQRPLNLLRDVRVVLFAC
jgi:hypothetical protein